MNNKEWQKHYHTAINGDLIGNWCITEDLEKVYYLVMGDIAHLLTEERIKSVRLKSIAWKNKHNFPRFNSTDAFPWSGERFDKADTNYPGIITDGPNPYDNEYRMIDGRRRLYKLLSNGITESNFYVIEWDELRPFFKSHVRSS